MWKLLLDAIVVHLISPMSKFLLRRLYPIPTLIASTHVYAPPQRPAISFNLELAEVTVDLIIHCLPADLMRARLELYYGNEYLATMECSGFDVIRYKSFVNLDQQARVYIVKSLAPAELQRLRPGEICVLRGELRCKTTFCEYEVPFTLQTIPLVLGRR